MNRNTGQYIELSGSGKAFIPLPLPPNPSVLFDEDMRKLLSETDQALARLDGIATYMPNFDLFLGMYVKKEALLSSQIEGTQASLEGILEFEADLIPKENVNEVKEVINYIKALYFGMDLLKKNQMTGDLIRELHRTLISGLRGKNKTPGEFRRIQNWIGPPGGSRMDAVFIPPPPENISSLMRDLEDFIINDASMPHLVKAALLHAQFETIHPFRDGNGRVGRLLITLYLLWKGIISKPLLYLSFYLKRHREQYYERLMKTRADGNWEDWIKFFLEGVRTTSTEALLTVKNIIDLKESLINRIYEKSISSQYAVKLIDYIFEKPLISVMDVAGRFKISKDTATKLVNKFADAAIIKEITGKERYRRYLFKEYVDIIARGTEI